MPRWLEEELRRAPLWMHIRGSEADPRFSPPYHLIEDIRDEPELLRGTLGLRDRVGGLVESYLKRGIERVIFTGAGSAYYTSVLAAFVLGQHRSGRPAVRARCRRVEGFAVVEELAALLGAAVGCSRAVTMAGWRPHSDQVGQTGTKIAPELYIPCGISGATQHMAGCKGAKHLLAVNPDAEAPIFASADYAVIGDLHEVLPAVSAAIRKAREAR